MEHILNLDEVKLLFREEGDILPRVQQLVAQHPQLVAESEVLNLVRMAINRHDIALLTWLLGYCSVDDGYSVYVSIFYRMYPDDVLDSALLDAVIQAGVKIVLRDDPLPITALSIAIKEVFRQDDLESFKKLVKVGFSPAEFEQLKRFSMFHSAIHEPRDGCRIAQYLLELGCSVNGFDSTGYDSPLLAALERSHFDLASNMLDKGADKAHIRYLPIEMANWPEIPEGLRDRLLAGCDLSEQPSGNFSAIINAVYKSNERYVRYLVAHGVDIDAETDNGTPLIFAITEKNKMMIECLLALGASVSKQGANKRSAIDVARATPGMKKICTAMEKRQSPEAKSLVKPTRSRRSKTLEKGEPWVVAANAFLQTQSAEAFAAWEQLFIMGAQNDGATPSNKWLKDANALLDIIGDEAFQLFLTTILPLLKEQRLTRVTDPDYMYGDGMHVISKQNTNVLKGLLWLASRYENYEFCQLLRNVAAEMYKKVYRIGMRNAKLANAAVTSLAMMSGEQGVEHIALLRAATRHEPTLVHINRIFDKLAVARNMSPDELAAQTVPDYGLTSVGEYIELLDPIQARLTLQAVGQCKMELLIDGVPQATLPATMKSAYLPERKALKELAAEIALASSAHCHRLEQAYLTQTRTSFGTWRNKYLNHFLMGFMCRRLIWRVTEGETISDVIFASGKLVDVAGSAKEFGAQALVELWHPSKATPEQVLAWREYLTSQQITQPFKQAHREVYLLTDAERATETHSLRFANHILNQSQFHALASQRGWAQRRGGMWDGGNENSATKKLPSLGLSVCFTANGVEQHDISLTGIYNCVATGEVSFSGEGVVRLADIDPLVFSEIMRDVDLFVSVCSISNDPNWAIRTDEYWQEFSFGELNEMAKTRKSVLQSLLPKLAIADRVSIDGNYVIVQGVLTTYKIHIGSANILMAPNHSYLCIVADKNDPQILLPFDGDILLSMILSKVMLLINDNKIRVSGF